MQAKKAQPFVRVLYSSGKHYFFPCSLYMQDFFVPHKKISVFFLIPVEYLSAPDRFVGMPIGQRNAQPFFHLFHSNKKSGADFSAPPAVLLIPSLAFS
jgi:hypothetical protein